jgi:hypothetical protein
MKLIAMILALLPLLAAAPADVVPRPAEVVDPSTQPVRFAAIDVRIDPQGQPLAAYQLEFVAPAEQVKLVGIEGGDHAAFKTPPYYDPSALSKNRVILAAFNTGSDLPKNETRVARLHVQITGSSEQTPDWTVKVMVASSSDGNAIANASATLAAPSTASTTSSTLPSSEGARQ